jgi:hypothetical protein
MNSSVFKLALFWGGVSALREVTVRSPAVGAPLQRHFAPERPRLAYAPYRGGRTAATKGPFALGGRARSRPMCRCDSLPNGKTKSNKHHPESVN